jgi:hypothetical protein
MCRSNPLPYTLSSRPERSEVEGSAVCLSPGNFARRAPLNLYFQSARSAKIVAIQAAEKLGLASLSLRLTNPEVARCPTLCHADRSEPGFPVTQPSPTATSAAFVKESRMKFADATNTNRKSGEAMWRDLLFSHPLSAIEKSATLPLVIPSVAEGSAVRLSLSQLRRIPNPYSCDLRGPRALKIKI